MKKLMLATVALMLTVGAMAQTPPAKEGMKFTDGSFEQIAAQATKDNKLIFMDIYTTWCGPCKFLASDIFPTKLVGDYANATFVNSKFDAEKGEGKTLAAKYKVTNYPTMLILNDKGEELGRIVGASRTPADFVQRLKDEMAKIDAKK